MASLQEIKSRLGSISTTKKITKAMQLVATAKLQRAKGNLESIQEYYTSVYQMFQDLLGNVKDVSKLFPEKGNDSILNIVITSDLGLAGGYNGNIIKLLKAEHRRGDKVIIIGSKGISAAKAAEMAIHTEFPGIGDDPNYAVASEIGKLALATYVAGEVNRVNIYYTKFINSVTFEATKLQLLPIETRNDDLNKSSGPQAVTEFEPDPETVLENALPLYTSAILFGSMVESKVSEMSSRRTAMENATDNAEELIEQLDLEYNRARQATITQEITEIVAGSNS